MLNLILEHVLHGIILDIGEPEHLHDISFNEIVTASNHCFVSLRRNLALLKIRPPSQDVLLRHATFSFVSLSYGAAKAVRHLSVTREQFEGLHWDLSEGISSSDSFEKLQTLTVRETMRAGANSSRNDLLDTGWRAIIRCSRLRV